MQQLFRNTDPKGAHRLGGPSLSYSRTHVLLKLMQTEARQAQLHVDMQGSIGRQEQQQTDKRVRAAIHVLSRPMCQSRSKHPHHIAGASDAPSPVVLQLTIHVRMYV